LKKQQTLLQSLISQQGGPVETTEWREVTVTIYAHEEGPAKLQLTYLVSSGASWSPNYDLRVDSKDKSLELTYYAYVSSNQKKKLHYINCDTFLLFDRTIRQNTGENWDSVSEVELYFCCKHMHAVC
jgi:hypothetical protein